MSNRQPRKEETVADAVTYSLEISLAGSGSIVSAVLRTGERRVGDATEVSSGPVSVEMYLVKGGSNPILLDTGFARSGGNVAQVVGIYGSAPYDEGDTLIARGRNDSGAVVTVSLEITTVPIAADAGFIRLSHGEERTFYPRDSGNAAGGVAVPAMISIGAGGELYEIGYVTVNALMDATVAARTLQVKVKWSLDRDARGSVVIPIPDAEADYLSPILTLSGTEQGSITVFDDGAQVIVNDNGVITHTADRGIPGKIEGNGLIQLATANTVAGDLTRLVVWVRRV